MCVISMNDGRYAMLKISKDSYVRKELVEQISAYEGSAIKTFVRNSKAGDARVVNCTGGKAVATVIVTSSGTVYLSSTTPSTICARMQGVPDEEPRPKENSGGSAAKGKKRSR